MKKKFYLTIFWCMATIWLFSVPLRALSMSMNYDYLVKGAFWGYRFQSAHFAVEALAVAATGWILLKRPTPSLAAKLGLISIVLLPVVQIMTAWIFIGGTMKNLVGGQMYEVDWSYHPRFGNDRLVLTVLYPGYRPTSAKYLNELPPDTMHIIKVGPDGPIYDLVLKTGAECWKGEFNRRNESGRIFHKKTCQFFVRGAWYIVSGKPEVPLEELIRDIPALFDGFKKNSES